MVVKKKGEEPIADGTLGERIRRGGRGRATAVNRDCKPP